MITESEDEEEECQIHRVASMQRILCMVISRCSAKWSNKGSNNARDQTNAVGSNSDKQQQLLTRNWYILLCEYLSHTNQPVDAT